MRGAARVPASEVTRKRRRFMPEWWGKWLPEVNEPRLRQAPGETDLQGR
jgi:hypothetical protein